MRNQVKPHRLFCLDVNHCPAADKKQPLVESYVSYPGIDEKSNRGYNNDIIQRRK